ncbi:large ribosomal subunit protein bL28m-like [Sycon ciliatum]|uniref:large ribosomal subunit protein bL28m-like n=1 Tax=Sycon ciliatum TaxID=27933 RepID=UPI0020ACEEC0|eukprot:scpid101179/ scgid24563/ 39S ribosomal protein L28, mitochondrial
MVYSKFTGFRATHYPERAMTGLWHNQGVQTGWDATPCNVKYKRHWKPNALPRSYHSKILNKTFFSLSVTQRCARYIDHCGGFDNYIIHTPVSKMNSLFGATVKEAMLKKLEMDPTIEVPEEVYRHRPDKHSRAAKLEEKLAKREPLRNEARQSLEAMMKAEEEERLLLKRNTVTSV